MKPKIIQLSLPEIPDFFEPRIVAGSDLEKLIADARLAGFWPCRMAFVGNAAYEVKFLREPSK